MFNARKFLPLLSAFADGLDSRAGGWILHAGSDMARATVPFPIIRGVTR